MGIKSKTVDWRLVAVFSCIMIITVVAILGISSSPRRQRMPLAPKETVIGDEFPTPPKMLTLQNHIEEKYFGLLSKGGEEVLPLLPYESISLERTPCLGLCPVYTVVFYRDGHATLVTDNPEKGEHSYTGKIGLWDYARLTQLVDLAKHAAKQEDYRGQWTDDYTAIIRVQSKDGAWKVSDYGEIAPPEVWALEMLLHSYREMIQWHHVEILRRGQPNPANT